MGTEGSTSARAIPIGRRRHPQRYQRHEARLGRANMSAHHHRLGRGDTNPTHVKVTKTIPDLVFYDYLFLFFALGTHLFVREGSRVLYSAEEEREMGHYDQ